MGIGARLRKQSFRTARIVSGIPMKRKLLIVFVFLIILPVSLANLIAYRNYSRLLTDSASDYTQKIADRMLDKLETYVEDMKRISVITQYAEELQGYLEDTVPSLERTRGIELYIQILNNMKKETHSVYIFDNDGRLFYHVKTMGLRSQVDEYYAEWKRLADEAQGSPVLISTQAVESHEPHPVYLFSIVKDIKSLATLQSVGLLVVDANTSVFREAVQELDQVTKGATIILDDADRVVYASDEGLVTQDLSEDAAVRRITGASGAFRSVWEGEEQLYVYTLSDKLGWKVLVRIPLDLLQQDANTTHALTLLITLAVIALALLLSLVSSHMLTKPLREMTKLMIQVQEGDLNVRFNVRHSDEIGLLGRNFNRMLDRIVHLIDEVYTMQIRRNLAEIEVLENQINPHFMYNTLEMIRMSAESNGDADVSQMVYILGKLLRHSFNRTDVQVRVRDEVDHVMNYLTLQNYRFKDRYRLNVLLASEDLDNPILPLVFQPIIENCILHGFERREGIGTITIHAERSSNSLRIIIADDGAGMTESRLAEIRTMLQTDTVPSSSKNGIGLRNIHTRLTLQYGAEYGLSIESVSGAGTSVSISLPTFR
jgi:two-component system sensor histidine kinase YesM